jgi:hypothetical protein
MPERIIVPTPGLPEESRQLAEGIADLHYVVGLIVEGAKELIPGEAVDDFTTAWQKSETSMRTLVQNLIPLTAPDAVPPISPATLQTAQLTGDVGKLKRSTLARLKDRFLMFWNSEPRNDEKRIKASEAAADYLEFGATEVRA